MLMGICITKGENTFLVGCDSPRVFFCPVLSAGIIAGVQSVPASLLSSCLAYSPALSVSVRLSPVLYFGILCQTVPAPRVLPLVILNS